MILLSCLMFLGCATMPDKNMPAELICAGDYECKLITDKKSQRLIVSGLDFSKLSSYEYIKPKTSGNRLRIYFDSNPKKDGPEYCLFMYKDKWTLRTESIPRYFNIIVAGGSYDIEHLGKTQVSIDLKEYLKRRRVYKCWNEK